MNRGDIYLVDLEPTKGREQRGQRPVLVVSADAFNRDWPPLVCPITSGAVAARQAGLTVSLASTGMQTQGVVLCSQIRVVDIKARGGRRVESAPDYIVDDVLGCLQDLLE